MNIDREALEKIPPDQFEKVWKIVLDLNERERHFNQLQSTYRTLASTWLLATFAGMGFVISEKVVVFYDKELVAAGLAFAGCIGIALIWVIDLLVYHQLLVAGYSVGKRFEDTYTWLPPVRRTFSDMKGGTAVRLYISAFYIAGVDVLLLTAGLWIFLWLRHEHRVAIPALLAACVGAVLAATLMQRIVRKAWERKPR